MAWALGAALLAFQGLGPEDKVGLRYRGWMASAGGGVDRLELKEDLGIQEVREAQGIEIGYALSPVAHVWFGAWRAGFHEAGAPGRTVRFSDETFGSEHPFEADLDLETYHLTLGRSLWRAGPDDLLEIRILAGALYLGAAAFLDDGTREAEEKTRRLSLLAGGMMAFEPTSWVRAEAGGAWSGYSVAPRARFTHWEAATEIVLRPFGAVFIGAGYRVISSDLPPLEDSGELDYDVRLRGFYVTMGLRF